MHKKERKKWNKIFGVEHKHYKTIEQASKATQKLGIRSATQYSRKRHQDPLLPKSPNYTYKDDWKGWHEFLGTAPRLRKNYYTTWQEASEVAREMGITKIGEYVKNRDKDEKLPFNPESFYQDWPGWSAFFRHAQEKTPPHAET